MTAADVFKLGQKIEAFKEAYEAEQKHLLGVKQGFVVAIKCLEDYRAAMLLEQAAAKITIKEAELGKIYVSKCIELLNSLYVNAEAKCFKAEGAVDALNKTVDIIKTSYDEIKTLAQKTRDKKVLKT